MEDDVKKYRFARYRQEMALSEKDKIRAIRENIPEKLIELKNQVEKKEGKEVSEEVKMAEELIAICITRYGENLERLEYVSDSKLKEIYRALNNFVKALKQQEKRDFDESREEK